MFALISQSLKVIIYVPMYVGNVFLNMLSNDILSVEYLLFHLELHVDVELFRHHAIIHPSIDLFRSEIKHEKNLIMIQIFVRVQYLKMLSRVLLLRPHPHSNFQISVKFFDCWIW